MLSADELNQSIRGCALNERESQKKIYNSFYGYAMAICDCYANNEDDAVEILNDGFLKIFREVHRYKPAYANEINSFKGWLRKIMVCTAIDHFRKNKKHRLVGELDISVLQTSVHEADGLDKISYDEIIRFIQKLSPAYRTVLCLFIIEGYSHEEIADQLGISVGTSKSNLAKARKQLQKILFSQNQTAPIKNVG
ncbi:MAG: sigma-70 family RNA polymerase sigma factor [Ferruginibacter sp.]|nr:sigma-70 family RNA polymerase sigma factor [Ferruginibacter sp.]HQY12545.1 sigma-70 family RNA polymerase sigma factor [Ferruginibacter sp.]